MNNDNLTNEEIKYIDDILNNGIEEINELALSE